MLIEETEQERKARQSMSLLPEEEESNTLVEDYSLVERVQSRAITATTTIPTMVTAVGAGNSSSVKGSTSSSSFAPVPAAATVEPLLDIVSSPDDSVVIVDKKIPLAASSKKGKGTTGSSSSTSSSSSMSTTSAVAVLKAVLQSPMRSPAKAIAPGSSSKTSIVTNSRTVIRSPIKPITASKKTVATPKSASKTSSSSINPSSASKTTTTSKDASLPASTTKRARLELQTGTTPIVDTGKAIAMGKRNKSATQESIQFSADVLHAQREMDVTRSELDALLMVESEEEGELEDEMGIGQESNDFDYFSTAALSRGDYDSFKNDEFAKPAAIVARDNKKRSAPIRDYDEAEEMTQPQRPYAIHTDSSARTTTVLVRESTSPLPPETTLPALSSRHRSPTKAVAAAPTVPTAAPTAPIVSVPVNITAGVSDSKNTSSSISTTPQVIEKKSSKDKSKSKSKTVTTSNVPTTVAPVVAPAAATSSAVSTSTATANKSAATVAPASATAVAPTKSSNSKSTTNNTTSKPITKPADDVNKKRQSLSGTTPKPSTPASVTAIAASSSSSAPVPATAANTTAIDGTFTSPKPTIASASSSQPRRKSSLSGDIITKLINTLTKVVSKRKREEAEDGDGEEANATGGSSSSSSGSKKPRVTSLSIIKEYSSNGTVSGLSEQGRLLWNRSIIAECKTSLEKTLRMEKQKKQQENSEK